MKKKLIYKISIDVIMTILLVLLMGRQLTGDSLHEWLGAGIFTLWILHHILNRSWYKHLFKGKYTPMRILQTVTNVAVFISMLGIMVSGIILSREVFAFLPISGGIAMARTLHMLGAFWGFVLMSLHLGLHWNMVLAMIRKMTGGTDSKLRQFLARFLAIFIAGYGLYAFLKNQFSAYMFLTSSFVFFDFERPVPLFFTEYIAIMGLFTFLSYYISKGVTNLAGRRKKIVAKEK